MTPYQSHVAHWKDCIKCPLHLVRNRIVLARGNVPAEVVFVGEAPGPSEDSMGDPFCGPAGQLLDEIIAKAVGVAGLTSLRSAFTNLVACIPLDESGDKWAEPPDESIEACSPRVREFVELCDRPIGTTKLIVAVGTTAKEWLNPLMKHRVDLHRCIKQLHIMHPSAILRMKLVQRDWAAQRCVVQLANALRSLNDA